MNELADIVEFLRAQPPFDRLDDAALANACRHIEVSYAREGTQILEFDTDNRELLIVRRGAVGLYDAGGELVDKRAEGETFGFPSLLTGKPTRFGVRAVEDTLLYHLEGEAFRHLRTDHPAFDRFFSAALVSRVESALGTRAANLIGAQPVAALMASPVVTIEADASVAQATQLMAGRGVSALPITRAGELVGIFTDRDLRNRVAARGLPYSTPIAAVMTPDPVSVRPDDSGFSAQLAMADIGIHHLPVVGADGLVGLVTLSDLIAEFQDEPVHFTGALRRETTVEGLAQLAQRRLELFARLVESGSAAAETERIMTGVTDAVTRRLIALAHERYGPAPLGYAWIAFGSQARAEQTGRTDQDNGLIFEHAPDEHAAQWFGQFASFVCDGLDAAGFVHCPGDVMASNPEWRRPLAGWQAHFAEWIDAPEPKALMFASIFFDIRAIHGEAPLVEDLRRSVYERAAGNSIFLRFMAGNALSFRPPVSFFRQFILEEDGQHNEGLNLKQRGVVPIVSLARLRALELGIGVPSTAARLAQAAARLPGIADDMGNLADALELISRIRHQHQAASIRAGVAPTNLVSPAELSPLTRRHLKAAFITVRKAQRAVEQLMAVR